MISGFWIRPHLHRPLLSQARIKLGGTCTAGRSTRRTSHVRTTRLFTEISRHVDSDSSDTSSSIIPVRAGTKLVLWRGEGTKGYSLQFRHLELNNAHVACRDHRIGVELELDGSDGASQQMDLEFQGATPMVDEQDDLYGAMQYVHFPTRIDTNENTRTCRGSDVDLDAEAFVNASKRSSLLREIYSVVSTGESFEELAAGALESNDKMLSELRSNPDSDLSWCVRLRQYGESTITIASASTSTSASESKGANRFGRSKRSSMKREKEAIIAMEPFLDKLHGRVQLKNPDCALYVFEGLNHVNKVLVRKLASGATTQSIAPITRQCVTRTPLCPLAAFIMCNLGRVKDGDRVLDPYSGSCSTLLASAMVATCQTVGIELAGNDVVDRDKIVLDFESRGLDPPKALIHGDCTDSVVRDIARRSIGGEPFDVIVADPPYGRREKASKDSEPPLVQFVRCIQDDFENGKPLLKVGGRLVVFVPTEEDENIEDNLPSEPLLNSAGLRLLSITEQPLSDTLSRWLTVYECTIGS